MNSKQHEILDFSEHRRKVFFERLHPNTTQDSLKKYLSAFEIEACIVPRKEGRNASYGFVIFLKEANVDSVMSQRPHFIDGAQVEVYRSVPGQGTLKEKKGVKYLIVSGLKNSPISESDISTYFSGFGKINKINMNNDQSSCCIEFDDYDSVDKALLNQPIRIRQVEIHITKGDRYSRWNSNPTLTTPKKSNLKQVQIDPQISSLNMPKKMYRIYITRLPSSVDAEQLSKMFSYDIGSILMSGSSTERSSTNECWLKHFEEYETAKEFKENWDRQVAFGTRIACEVEEDEIEFCNKYRVGNCSKSAEECDWEHVMCTANGKCSDTCSYGHEQSMKKPFNSESNSRDTYQLKITGVHRGNIDSTSNSLSREKNFIFDDRQANVGYIRYIKTMKYAKRLLFKYRNKSTSDYPLKFQIELFQVNPISKTSSRSDSFISSQQENTDNSPYNRNRQLLSSNSSRASSRNSSLSRETSDPALRVADEPEFSYATKTYQASVDKISNQKLTDEKRKYKSVDNLVEHEQPIPKCSRKSEIISNENGSSGNGILIEYELKDQRIYEKELTALKLLKNVNGVVQLINSNDGFDYKDHQSVNRKRLYIQTDCPLDYTLQEFVKRIHRGGFKILEAVHLIQNLTRIVKDVHSKGVLHQNLSPKNIFIDWDEKSTSAEEAIFTLTDFSQAHIVSEKNYQSKQSAENYWYQAPQLQDEILKHSSTVDASSLCALLFWLLTNVDPKHDGSFLPHQSEDIMTKLNNKIGSAVRESNSGSKHLIEETQVKTYLIDTFNIAFGYPHQQPWTISDFACRLESIRELLLPRNRELLTITNTIEEIIFMNISMSLPKPNNPSSDTFEKAANAFAQAKSEFVKMHHGFSWSDGGCVWLHGTEISSNERCHDDILTYERRKDRQLHTQSFIITSFITLSSEKDAIILSIGTAINGKMIRIPIGCYSKSQNYIGEFQKNFTTELNRLFIAIAKERNTMA